MHGLNLKHEERFLFKSLPDVVRLEGAMKDIRQKYSQFWDGICDRVQREHKLDWNLNHSTRSDAQVGIGRRSWPSTYNRWCSGFYLHGISLERLCSPSSERPCAGIWIQLPKDSPIDLQSLKKKFNQIEANLSSFSSVGISLWFDLGPQQELFDLLANKKEAQFANCMVSHFRRLAKLIPLVDKVFEIKKTRKA